MTLNGVMVITLRYLTEFGNCVISLNLVTWPRRSGQNLCTSIFCSTCTMSS